MAHQQRCGSDIARAPNRHGIAGRLLHNREAAALDAKCLDRVACQEDARFLPEVADRARRVAGCMYDRESDVAAQIHDIAIFQDAIDAD